MMRELILYIEEYILIQCALLQAFKSKFTNLEDWKWLLDFPRSGEVSIEGESWTFKKHGAGLMFSSSDGIVVDAHDMLENEEVIDAWRLEQFIESKSKADSNITYEQLKNMMSQLVADEKLEDLGGDKYRLAS